MRNRRDPRFARMRDYVDGLKQAESTSDAEWLESWIPSGMPWMSRQDWITILRDLIAAEAIALWDNERKVA